MIDFAIVLIVIFGMDGQITHKSEAYITCPTETIDIMSKELEVLKEKKSIADYGMICFPGQFSTNSELDR
jgi:hypothetical protein